MSILINKAAAIYVLCWTFLPFMQIGDNYRLIAVICAGVWGITAVANDSSFINKYIMFFLGVIAAAGGMVIWRNFLGLSVSSAITQTIQFMIMMIACMIAIYYHENDLNFLKKVFPLLLILILIFSITTIQGVIENPYASRIANSEWLENRYEGNEMIGLYGFVYMCVFIVPMLLHMNLNRIKVGNIADILVKIDFWILLIMILCSGYMIAILCTLGSCIFIWAVNSRNPIKITILIVLFVIFTMNYEVFIQNIFSFLINRLSDNPVYYQKLVDIQSLFLAGDVSGVTVDGRFSNYAASFSNVKEYPLFGCYFWGESGGGGHSAILDVFGRFGAVIGTVYMCLICIVPHKIGYRQRRWNPLDYMLLFVTLIFGFLDPFFQEMGIPIYIIFPLIKAIEREEDYVMEL